jgi:hypothetical protein|tara:strand:+ start:310 stop:963 length:654 start_codon:yes stop_codon:yes gene_type:complete
MLCHLNYTFDKSYYKKYFFDNYDKGDWHKDLVDESGGKLVRGTRAKNKIDYINTHGISTPVGDIAELKAFKKWRKMFDVEDAVKSITNDLGIQNLNIKPRFSYQLENSTLPSHIDIDRIVAINLKLDSYITPGIIIEGKLFQYENALLDVGAKVHSVESYNGKPRLVLKYAIRNNWQEIYNILDKRKLIDHTKTYFDNPNYDLYESKLLETDKQFVK